MTVIGFLTYTDFLAELNQRPLWGQPVRVQHYHRSKPDRQDIVYFYTFIVEAAVSLSLPSGGQTETLVCRFITGKTSVICGHDWEDKLTKLDRRNRRAAEILRQDLRSNHIPVRSGLIAAAADSQTEADPSGLWTAEDLTDGQDRKKGEVEGGEGQ